MLLILKEKDLELYFDELWQLKRLDDVIQFVPYCSKYTHAQEALFKCLQRNDARMYQDAQAALKNKKEIKCLVHGKDMTYCLNLQNRKCSTCGKAKIGKDPN